MTATLVLVLRVGLAIVLYLFLWRILQILRQELKQQGDILSLRIRPGIHINAVLDTGKEYSYNFWQPEILIGRSPTCNIAINDKSLSAGHARVSFHHAQWWLEDLGSTNGTILNKNHITTPTVIISGDQFKCGNTTFTLRVESISANPQGNKNSKPEV